MQEFDHRGRRGHRDREENGMKIGTRQNALRGSLFCASLAFVLLLWAQAREGTSTQEWPVVEPNVVDLDSTALAALDADIVGGKYGLVDSMLVVRDGKQAFALSYLHDYGKIYGELAKHEGPLNHDVNGPYNYFSAEFHPYYQRSDLHTMQSVSKSVTSITIGIAIARHEF